MFKLLFKIYFRFNPSKSYIASSYGEYEASHERIIESPYVNKNLNNKGYNVNNGNYENYANNFNGYETNSYNNRLKNFENYENKQNLPYVSPSLLLPSSNIYGSNYLTPNQNNYGTQYSSSVGIPYSNNLKPNTDTLLDNYKYSLPSNSNYDNIFSQTGYTNKGEASVYPLNPNSINNLPYSARNRKATQKGALTSKVTSKLSDSDKEKVVKN